LKLGLPNLIKKHLPLRLAIQKSKEGHLFFVHANPSSLEPNVLISTDVEWPDCEALNLGEHPRGARIAAPDEALFHLRICSNPKTGQVGLRSDINHVLCDGRTAFDLLGMFCNVAIYGTDSSIPPCISLPEFGHKDYFSDVVHDTLSALDKEGRIPDSWTRIPRGLGRLIAGFPEPAVYENLTFRYAFSPIAEFCTKMGRDKGYSVQSLLMAAKTRAIREYCGLPPSKPLAVYAPTDTRSLEWSTEINRSTPFFCHAGCNVPLVCGTGDILEDIRSCSEAMQSCIKGIDPCLQIMRTSRVIDATTLTISPDLQTPSTTEDHLVAASNLGNVTRFLPDCNNKLSCSDVWLGCTYPCSVQFFSLNIYGYRCADVLSILSMRPNTLDDRFTSILLKNLDEIFINTVGSHKLP